MDYNPRAATGIPTEPVGSIPRPLKLQQAYADYEPRRLQRTNWKRSRTQRSRIH